MILLGTQQLFRALGRMGPRIGERGMVWLVGQMDYLGCAGDEDVSVVSGPVVSTRGRTGDELLSGGDDDVSDLPRTRTVSEHGQCNHRARGG